MRISLPETINVNPDVLFQELATETVLLNIGNEQYFGLDDIGSRMWQLFSENNNANNVNDVLTQMLDEFDVDEDRLGKDLLVFIEQLSEAGLVSIT